MFTDIDWARGRATRQSTSGGAMMIGSHSIKTWSKDQSVVALSRGEAELYVANFGAAQALGMNNLAAYIGVKLEICLLSDAKAAMGIINRQGLGKVRHIEVQDLWLQGTVKNKKVTMHKVRSEDNVSDLMTKPLTAEEINTHVINLNGSWND